MKKHFKLVLLVALFASYCIPSWGQAPSTEGTDFWVTFLQASERDGGPQELKLTISAKEACHIHIENPNNPRSAIDLDVADNSSTEIGTQSDNNRINQADCYSMSTDGPAYTALHVTASKDISLFAGNYRDKSFDAANILPTAALLDDYLIQTYPPSDHENKPQGSHFAIVAVEDNTIVDYTLTAKANNQNPGTAQSVSLKKGQVYYVWTGRLAGEEADLSGSTVKARNGKKIAVFQGCPHTNVPIKVRDRDHLFSQAMPTAYWGTEFGITASRHHRRDIVAVMALNDGTVVYINNEDGEKVPVHTFDFTKDKKHYWTFEIGEYLAYCADDEAPSYGTDGKLPEPLVVDSSCFLTTSCPAGVHLFMVSNRYDNVVNKVKSDTLISDPAMLWISPIEQVIKEINFSTYSTKQDSLHYMNIVTSTSNTKTMTWNGNSIQQYFHPIRGNEDYSFARIEIQSKHLENDERVNHNLKGTAGFLAHVYGYGQRESYAYSCGSSTIQRSIVLNDTPLDIDSVSNTKFCVNDTIEMRLSIGSNDYESVHWDYGDGVTFLSDPNATNDEKKVSYHKYTSPGWYDLKVTAVYRNTCTGQQYTEPLGLKFYVGRPDTIRHTTSGCVAENYQGEMTRYDTTTYDCDSIVINQVFLHRESSYEYTQTANERAVVNGVEYTSSQDITWVEKNAENCDSTITCHLQIVKCLDMQIENKPEEQETCAGKTVDIPFSYCSDAAHGQAFMYIVKSGTRPSIATNAALQGDGYYLDNETAVTLDITGEADGRKNGVITLPIRDWKPGRYIVCIRVEDLNCLDDQGNKAWEQSTALNVTVKYPEDIMVFKFNNVLAVYQKGFGGNKGYDFTAYQWYRNGEKIDALLNPSAATSIYHTEEIFTPGDEYYVELTDKDNITLPSCGFTVPSDLDDYNPTTTQNDDKPAATKKLINNRMCIEFRGQIYDAYGQRVK